MVAPPLQVGFTLALALVGAVGGATTVTTLLPVHPLSVSVAYRVRLKPLPAVYVTVVEVLPPVIVPPVMVQLYVPPAGLVMVAVLPIELAHTAVAPENVGVAGTAFAVAARLATV
jgi:hypothetical protein